MVSDDLSDMMRRDELPDKGYKTTMKTKSGVGIRHFVLVVGMILFGWAGTSAQGVMHDTTRVHFPQSVFVVDTLYLIEGESLPAFVERSKGLFNNSAFTLKNIHVVGAASPEGALQFNQTLARRRALSVADYLKEHLSIADSLMQVTSIGVDWEGLEEMVMNLENMPDRDEVMRVLQHPDYGHNERLWRLKQIDRRIPYEWMYKHLFPSLRYSRVIVSYEMRLLPEVPPLFFDESLPVESVFPDTLPLPESVSVADPVASRPFYWALKTNALYDVAMVPNVGVEIYIGKGWSVNANWMYAWWSKRSKNNFWRIYGGDVEVRRWLGEQASRKTLQGHHVGVYGQGVTYDFELGGRGYLGDKWSFGGGLSYGYSLPVGKRLNMDFTLGLGYLTSEYKEYLPIEGHYVWQLTKRLHWWGPTKAEVSLVWLLGRENANRQKGGTR